MLFLRSRDFTARCLYFWGLVPAGVSQEQLEAIKRRFDKFDVDGTGILTKEQFSCCLHSVGYVCPGVLCLFCRSLP